MQHVYLGQIGGTMDQRRSGILLHPTSLPGPDGIGSFGSEARHFVDFLQRAGQTLWQILPLGPAGHGNSPYSCYSAFAGNPLLIDLETLCAAGDCAPSDLNPLHSGTRIDYEQVAEYKLPLLHRAARRFLDGDDTSRKQEFWHFCDSTFWLHDYALFMAAKDHCKGKPWHRWPRPLAQRSPEAVHHYSEKLGAAVGEHKYIQWQFYRQWQALRSYAHQKGIQIIGDAPIFVAHDSADVWCNQHLFQLDETGKPLCVAGVPPDYFSKTGQRWGNPLYKWERLKEDGYGWWIARLKNDLGLYDQVRIDHFRGFEAFWEIPASHKTAVKGSWRKCPGEDFFERIKESLGRLPIIAEDLGVITPEVESLRDRFGFPGMKILQFAFEGGAGNLYLPHNYIPNSIVYTGTHDNDTTLGWFSALSAEQQERVALYLNCNCRGDEVVTAMIRGALGSVARYAIVPLQDLLRLDSTARMNIPGSPSGNWGWRYTYGMLNENSAEELLYFTRMYGR